MTKQIKAIIKFLLRVYTTLSVMLFVGACLTLISKAEELSANPSHSTVGETISMGLGAVMWMIPIVVLIIWDFIDTDYKLITGSQEE